MSFRTTRFKVTNKFKKRGMRHRRLITPVYKCPSVPVLVGESTPSTTAEQSQQRDPAVVVHKAIVTTTIRTLRCAENNPPEINPSVSTQGGYLRGMHIEWGVPLRGVTTWGCNLRGVNLQGVISGIRLLHCSLNKKNRSMGRWA